MTNTESFNRGYDEGVKDWSKLAEIAPPEEWLMRHKHYLKLLNDKEGWEKQYNMANEGRERWSELNKIAPPEKWMEMYKNYQQLDAIVETNKLLQYELDVRCRAIEIAFETLRQVFKDNPNAKI